MIGFWAESESEVTDAAAIASAVLSFMVFSDYGSNIAIFAKVSGMKGRLDEKSVILLLDLQTEKNNQMEEKEIKIYPFSLEAVEDEAVWGTESWKLSDLGFRDSKIRRGLLEGNTISEVMETYLDRIVGDDTYYFYGRQFPVQVKELKVTSRQPLLVCPDDEIAGERYDSLGKLKIWYIAQAAPDAKVMVGFRHDLSATDFYEACLDGSIADHLNEVPVKKGDCYLIKPGTVHCADKGVTIIEVSESSDLDLRICNWGRTMDSQDDPVFLEEAFDFVNMKAETPILTDSHKLSELEQFIATRIDLADPVRIENGESKSYTVYHCVSGSAVIQTPAVRDNGEKYMESMALSAGETAVVPAEIQEFFLVPNAVAAVLIEVRAGEIEREIQASSDSEDEEGSRPITSLN